MVSAVLSPVGHHVDLASDGWEALIRTGRARPDLIVSELQLPTTDGWTLADSIRALPETADVPFLFLGTRDTNPAPAFRAGIDLLVAKPFRLEQLESAVARVLARRQGDEDTTPEVTATHVDATTFRAPDPSGPVTTLDGAAALTGALEHFGLSSLLIVCELERKSGVLTLTAPEATGHVWLRAGRVIRARIDGTGNARGALAVYDLLTWTRGRFEFAAVEVDGDDEIAMSTSFLLLEGARLQDERKQAARR